MAKSRTLTVQIVGDPKGLNRALGSVDKQTRTTQGHLERLGKHGALSLRNVAKSAAGLAAAYVSISQAKDAVNVTTDLAKATIGLNKNLGLSVKTASEWAAVAKVRGIETKQLAQSFGILGRNAETATEQYAKQRVQLSHLGKGKKDLLKQTEALNAGAGKQANAFRTLGITQDDLVKSGGNFNKLLSMAADGFGKLEPGTRRNTAAMTLFGRGWQTIVPVLRDGSKAMQEQLDLADKYGVTFSGKTIKSTKDLIAAQREAKFATLGLQLAFGTMLAPALTKGITATAHFVAEIRNGTGTGGKFAHTVKDIAKSFVPAVDAFVAAAKWAKRFGDEHPGIRKVAVQVGAVALAFRVFKIGAAIRAVRSFTDAAIATPGAVRKALGGVRGVFRSVFTGAGTAGGTAGAEGVGSALSKRKGFFTSMGMRSGKLLGKGLVIGIVAGIALWGPEIKKAIQEQIDNALDDIDLSKGPFDLHPDFLGGLGGLHLPGQRAGGMIGGARPVPGMLSPGEVGIEPDGTAWRVPGPRTAADIVPAMLRPGTAILTGSGQRMVASGASVLEAVRRQTPHFATGGLVGATRYGYGEPGTGTRGYRGDSLAGKMAYAELGQAGRIGNALGGLPYKHPLRIAYKGRAVIARKLDVGLGGGPISGKRRAIDLWRDTASALHFPGSGVVRITGAGKGVPGGGNLKFTKVTPARISHPLLGNMLAPLVDDVLLGGIEAGTEGTSRRGLLTNVLEGILPQSGDRATRERVDFGRMPSGPRSGPGGGGGPVGAAIAEARKLDHARYPYVWGGGHVQPARATGGGYDCSGAVARVMQQAGFDFPTGVSGQYASWGASGPGKQVTVFANPVHTFMKIKGSYFGTSRTNPGGGPGWLGTSYGTSGFTARHPPGYRGGGIVGYQGGGIVEDDVNFSRLFRFLGQDSIGSRRADTLARMLSRHARSLSIGQLLRLQAGARRQIRRMARHGFTGPERIRSRRLQGGLSILQDEMGRPIGRALGASDRAQERISRAEARLPSELLVAGIDPESAEGLTAQRTLAEQSLDTLGTRRAALVKALRRAKRTGNKGAIRAAQAELNEVDDQILGLRGAIVTLNKTMEQTNEQATADALRENTEMVRQLKEAIDRQTAIANSVAGIGQATALKAFADVISGQIAGYGNQRARSAGDGVTGVLY